MTSTHRAGQTLHSPTIVSGLFISGAVSQISILVLNTEFDCMSYKALEGVKEGLESHLIIQVIPLHEVTHKDLRHTACKRLGGQFV